MNTTKQFCALFKFQTTIYLFLLIMFIPLGAIPLLMNIFSASDYSNLSFLLPVQNLFFVGMIGMWALAPEMAQRWGVNSGWSSGTEFLLTRAIDRPVLYRSRAAYFYLLVFLMPLVSLLYSLGSPDLKATEYSKPAQQECLSHVPGSALEPNPSGSLSPLISIPRGKVLVAEWYFWMFAASALIAQALLLLLYSFKHRLFIFYALFMPATFAPLFIDLHRTHAETTPHVEHLFFFFTSHQPLFWILTALLFIFAQLWCERRFACQEQ